MESTLCSKWCIEQRSFLRTSAMTGADRSGALKRTLALTLLRRAQWSHPDLVGQTAGGDWIVVEAKGRSNSFDQAALEHAKEQAQAVVTIGGAEPVLRIGMVTHFSGDDNGQLRFRASDPPPDERRVHWDLPLTRERLMEGYYRPFRTWLSRSQRTTEFGGRIFRIAEADNADFTVGLAENQLEQGFAGISEPEHHVRNENYYVGRDGVLVMLGSMWSPKNMRLEPQSRTRS